MNIYVVGERKLVEAFELIGVRGQFASADTPLDPLLRDVIRREQVALLLVQAELAAALSEELRAGLAHEFQCLVLEVPGINQPAPDPSAWRRRVLSVVGAAR